MEATPVFGSSFHEVELLDLALSLGAVEDLL